MASLVLAAVTLCFSGAFSFVLQPRNHQQTILFSSPSEYVQQAEKLKAQAKEIRDKLRHETGFNEFQTKSQSKLMRSPWRVPLDDADSGKEYRLYLDIGREPGTWMDPRWGASGKRIEFSLDVFFAEDALASEDSAAKMVNDNFAGNSSPVCDLKSATKARLRNGFDEMKCYAGAYRIDIAKGASTVRFYVQVDGTPPNDSPYGDVVIPKGCLYFSLPVFSKDASQLSRKEGPVTVRQFGWHTGWRREESRIVGIFKALPIEEALIRDGF